MPVEVTVQSAVTQVKRCSRCGEVTHRFYEDELGRVVYIDPQLYHRCSFATEPFLLEYE